jgi:hypothetical protein
MNDDDDDDDSETMFIVSDSMAIKQSMSKIYFFAH